jgi:HAD superfamily hydrolase (TIGR01509 family)
MTKAFIFDMDGVILDSEPIHFEVDILTMEHFGVQIEKEQLERFVGMTNPEMWHILKLEYQLTSSVEEIIEYQLTEKINRIQLQSIKPIEGIIELIRQLRSHRIPIGLASSSPRRFIEAVLTKLRIAEDFECVVSGEEVPLGKPAPDVYLEAASQLGVNPTDCYVLEDSRNGIAAAVAAGMRVIGYVNLNSGNQDLSAANPIVTSIGDINIDRLW